MVDFNYKQSPAFSEVLNLVANQRVKEQQIAESQQNVQKSKVDMIRGVAQDASSMVNGMVTAARENQKRSALSDLSSLFAKGSEPTPGTLPEGVSGPQPQYTSKFQTPEFQNQARSLLFKAAPDEATKELAKQLFPDTGSVRNLNKFQKVEYQDAEGNTRIGSYDPVNHTVIQNADDPLRGYAPSVFMDPTTGLPMMAPKSPNATATPIKTPEVQPGNDGQNNALIRLRNVNPKVASDVENIRAKAYPQNNPTLKDNIEAASSASTVREIVSEPNPSQVALAGLGFHLARMSGSNSQLSDAEREIFQEPLAFLRKLENKGWKFVAGDLSPTMKQDLKKLATTLERKSQRQAFIQINGAKLQAKGTAGGYWTPELEKEFPNLNELIAQDKATNTSTPNADLQDRPFSSLSDDELKARIEKLKAGRKP